MTKPAFLLDSNICVYLLKGLSEPARSKVEGQAPGAVVTSAVAYAEVMRGVDSSDRRAVRAAGRFFSAIPVLPFDQAAAAAYVRLPFKRAQFDRLIAAHAVALGVTLITNNVRDFSDVPGLVLENWTHP